MTDLIESPKEYYVREFGCANDLEMYLNYNDEFNTDDYTVTIYSVDFNQIVVHIHYTAIFKRKK